MIKEDNKKNEYDQNLEFKSLDYIMSERFSRYAKYIILQRALPDVRDGLKPVQRRILYSMFDLNLNYNKGFKKSARVVGDVIGKYHPHGDSSIYDALVRMAQDWKMNMPLVEMHGNKGSIDDDPAAAMRYTEVRLTKISQEILSEVKKQIVPFAPNFDDTEKEPVVLPSYIPNLLINGARGIAAGFATEIPPHNLKEVLSAAIAKIKKPELSVLSLKKYILGPDFPTGGIIYGQNGIDESFERGSGKIKISSKYLIISNPKEHKIIIEQIPYGVIKSKLVKQIDDLRINANLTDIKDVRDESDREGISIAIYLEKDANSSNVIAYLLKKTDLQIHYSYNMISIDHNSPKLLGISRMLDCYISFIKKLKRKSLTIDLDKAEIRLEIILGFIRVTEIIDEVIKVIRKSSNSKAGVILDLQNELNFSELQAKAIAEMQLYRLNRTDVNIYLSEKSELEKKISEIKLLLNNSEFFDNHLIEMLKQIKKEYGIERKTHIGNDQDANLINNVNEFIADEIVYLFLTKDGYLKKVSKRTYESNEISSFGIKENDDIIFFGKSNNKHKMLIFSNKGNYIFLPVHKIEESKWKSNGIHISDFASFESNEKILDALSVDDFTTQAFIVSITKQAMGKKSKIALFNSSRYSKPSRYMKLRNSHDEIIGIKLSNGNEDLLLITNDFLCWKYSENHIPNISLKSSGNIMAKLRNNYISAFVLANNNDKIIMLNNRNKFKELYFKSIAANSKSNKGKKIIDMNSKKENNISKIYNSEHLSYIYKDKFGTLFSDIFKPTNNIPLDANFTNFAKNCAHICFNQNLDINSSSYFSLGFITKNEKEIMEQTGEIMAKAFAETEEKIKEIDEKELDDLLKKLKL